MIHLRDRSILGITAFTTFVSSVYILADSASSIAVSSFSVSVFFAYLAFGNIGGLLALVVSTASAFIFLARAGRYSHLAFLAAPYLAALAGYLYVRLTSKMDRSYSLKLEKMDEEINLLSGDIKEDRDNIISLREKLTRYSALKDVTEALSTVLSLEEINRLIVENTLKVLGKEGRALLFLVDTGHQELMLSASRSTQGPLKVKAKKGDIFDNQVLRHRKSLIIEDITKDFRFSADDAGRAKAYFRSLIATPLISENKVVGILRMDNLRESAYSQDDLRLLDILSALGAVAVQNAVLYSRTQELAIRDGLTGLFVRRYFMERFRTEMKRAARTGGRFSLLMLDIDHFKEYNDRYGHTSGDLVLKHLAGLVTSSMKEGDILARYGGEEIACLLYGADRREGALRAEAIRALIEDNPLVLRREKNKVTVSIGVSSYPQDAVLEEELIRIADERLYQAKAKGRNRVCSG